MNHNKCESERHFCEPQYNGKQCPYDDMSAEELSKLIKQEIEDKSELEEVKNTNIQKMGEIQVKKSIRSLNKKITEHKDKINNPKSSWKEWDTFSKERKENEIKKWKKEIKAFEKNIKELNKHLIKIKKGEK